PRHTRSALTTTTPPTPTPFPTRRSSDLAHRAGHEEAVARAGHVLRRRIERGQAVGGEDTLRHGVDQRAFGAQRNHQVLGTGPYRSEEHTSELQSHLNLVCRLLLEKKK